MDTRGLLPRVSAAVCGATRVWVADGAEVGWSQRWRVAAEGGVSYSSGSLSPSPRTGSPAPDQIRSTRDLDRSFPCWPGSGYFGTAPGGVLSLAEGPRPFQVEDPRPPQTQSKGGETTQND